MSSIDYRVFDYRLIPEVAINSMPYGDPKQTNIQFCSTTTVEMSHNNARSCKNRS